MFMIDNDRGRFSPDLIFNDLFVIVFNSIYQVYTKPQHDNKIRIFRKRSYCLNPKCCFCCSMLLVYVFLSNSATFHLVRFA